MKSIYIGVCKTRDDDRFKESFHEFTNAICEKYSICIDIQSNRFLPDAQNTLAKAFIDYRYDYLLLLDDDHSGHTLEMLDTLINANTYVATIKTYSRHYPYGSALLKEIGNNCYASMERGDKYQEVDITGFPMTLIRRDVFEILEEPYFRALDDGCRNWSTDVDFFKRLAEKGIKPIGCFEHCLNHDKITPHNVHFYRLKERDEKNMMLYDLLQSQGAIK